VSIVNTIRVALVGTRPRLRDILADVVAREQDMELMHYGGGPDADLIAARPDVVVCEIENPFDIQLPTRLLRAVPQARVLMVADTGKQAAVYELRPTRKVLPNVSIDEVIEAIRFGLEQNSGGTSPGLDEALYD
jgi:DNA-binding NarL/FixJ family response regulator